MTNWSYFRLFFDSYSLIVTHCTTGTPFTPLDETLGAHGLEEVTYIAVNTYRCIDVDTVHRVGNEDRIDSCPVCG